jgi:hypothetical protein
LSDADASKVDATPVLKTVHWLVSQDPPNERPENNRIPTIELTTFAVEARLLGFKRENSDRDFHIVIGDMVVRETMIVEIPNPQCKGVCASAAAGAMLQAGRNFVRHCGAPTTNLKKLTKPFWVHVTGVGFFDFQHRQTGVAKNAIELHPVLKIDFPDDTDDCARHLAAQ